MNRDRRFVLLLLIVLCSAGLYQANRAIGARHQADGARADLARRTDLLETEIERRQHAPGAEPLASVVPTTLESSEGGVATVAPIDVRSDASKLIGSHPEVLKLFEKAFSARFDAEYRAFFDQIALSPDRVARFKQRLFQDRVDRLDLHWTAESQGAKRDDSVFQTLRREQEDALRGDLREILGSEGQAALERFRRANAVRGFVDEIATSMTFAGKPMTLDQQDQLVQVIAEASARFQKGGNAMPWDANWDAIMRSAPMFLTDAQVVALRENGDERVRFVWMLPQFYAQHRPGAK